LLPSSVPPSDRCGARSHDQYQEAPRAFADVVPTGPGDYSLDAVLGLRQWWAPQITTVVLAAGVVGGFGSLMMRRPASPVAHA
jgi:hypothetical protein